MLVGAAGAPWLRHAAFLEVARELAAPRRLAIVTSEQRARSVAASVHLPAYASVAALDRNELDPTERLRRPGRVRSVRPARRLPRPSRRALAIAGSLAVAALLVLAVVVPDATVVVAPTTKAFGPMQIELRAGPGGDVQRTTLSETLTTKVQGAASGSRQEPIKATGVVQLANRQTRQHVIPRGSPFRTADNILFVSTEERILPASVIFGPLQVSIGTVVVPIEAVLAGPAGNVGPGRIRIGPSPVDYDVTNPQPTAGGEIKRIPIVQRADYLQAASPARVRPAVHVAAEDRLARWRREAPPNTYVVERKYTTVTGISPESDVVGKEVDVFEITVTFVATAFAVAAEEPRRTAIARLRAASAGEAGFVLSEQSIRYDEVLNDDPTDSGVISWSITMSGALLARVEPDRIRRAVAGRGPDEVAGVLERTGVQLVELRRQPDWWPRLPVLDLRIRIDQVPATATR